MKGIIFALTLLLATAASADNVSLGSRVQVWANTNVRTGAGTGNSIACVQPLGSMGTVVEGPELSGFVWSGPWQKTAVKWWKVDFDASCDGWVAWNLLAIVP